MAKKKKSKKKTPKKNSAPQAETATVTDPSEPSTDKEIQTYQFEDGKLVLVKEDKIGHFYSSDSYCCLIPKVGADKQNIAYVWHGSDSPLKDDIGSVRDAILTLTSATALPAYVSMNQGSEPTYLREIYTMNDQPGLVVHAGGDDPKPLYRVSISGSDKSTAYGLSVSKDASSINSQDCFVMIMDGLGFLWMGKGSSDAHRDAASAIAGKIAGDPAAVIKMTEGEEMEEFWEPLGGRGAYEEKRPDTPVPVGKLHTFVEGKWSEVGEFSLKEPMLEAAFPVVEATDVASEVVRNDEVCPDPELADGNGAVGKDKTCTSGNEPEVAENEAADKGNISTAEANGVEKGEAEAKKLEKDRVAAEAKKTAEEAAAEEAKGLEEEKAAAEAKKLEEEKAAAEAKKATEEKEAAEAKKAAEEAEAAAVEAKKLEEEKAAAEAKKLEEERMAADAKKAAEAKKAEEEAEAAAAEAKRLEEEEATAEAKKKAEEEAAAAEAKRLEEEKAAAEAKRLEEEKAAAEAKKLEEEKAAAEAKKKAEEEAAAAEAKRVEEEARAAEAKKLEEEKAVAEAKKKTEEEAAAAEAKRLEEEARAAEAKKLEEEKAAAEAKKKAEEEAAAAKKLEEEKAAVESSKSVEEKPKEVPTKEDKSVVETEDKSVGEKKFYSMEELKSPINGVDFASREQWLSDEDFVALFEMPKDEFKGLAKWKRIAKKKSVGLF